MFAVVVDFEIVPEHASEFLSRVRENASNSLTQESGCKLFDVCWNEDAPQKVFLYELYDDAAAFDAHLASAHFRAFDAAVAPMIHDKTVRTFTEVA